MKLRRKTIIAGSLVKIVEYTPTFPHDNSRSRSIKQRTTRAAQKALNFRTAQGRLESKLAANFSSNDYFVTFTFREDAVPHSRKEANRCKDKYIRRLRKAYGRRGSPLRWIFAVENQHGEGRYHFHAVINSTGSREDAEEIISLWDYGEVHLERLFNRDHDSGDEFNTWLQVAVYMTKERPEYGKDTTPVGAQIYSCSRNLIPPVIMPTVWVDEAGPLEIPEGAIIIESETKSNEFGHFSYVKYMTRPLRPPAK